MEFTANTKLTDIMEAYPWLPDELIKMNSAFGIVKTPIGKMMIKNATLADLSKKIGITDDEVIEQLRKMIDEHEE
ncbi:MAG: hypothetical protein IJJ15_03045 [Ruminococcus sp.]|nr:hypothetical protein [Ruminococcus sp.]